MSSMHCRWGLWPPCCHCGWPSPDWRYPAGMCKGTDCTHTSKVCVCMCVGYCQYCSIGTEGRGGLQDQSLRHTCSVSPRVMEEVHRQQRGGICQLLDHRFHSQCQRSQRQRPFQGHFNQWCHRWLSTWLRSTQLQPVMYLSHTVQIARTTSMQAISFCFSLIHNRPMSKEMLL